MRGSVSGVYTQLVVESACAWLCWMLPRVVLGEGLPTLCCGVVHECGGCPTVRWLRNLHVVVPWSSQATRRSTLERASDNDEQGTAVALAGAWLPWLCMAHCLWFTC